MPTNRVPHADETPVAMLDPVRGKTQRPYVWACARGEFDPLPGVIYEFCLGRGARYPIAFLQSSEERLDRHPAWKDLFSNEAEALAPRIGRRRPRPTTPVAGHVRRKRGRKPLDPALPRVIVRHEPTGVERVCAHDGHTLVEIGVDIASNILAAGVVRIGQAVQPVDQPAARSPA